MKNKYKVNMLGVTQYYSHLCDALQAMRAVKWPCVLWIKLGGEWVNGGSNC